MYRKYLFTATRRFNISVLAHVVTSNHVHLLIATGDRGRPKVSEALQYVHGEVGQHYNMARNREGSFWSNRFHAARVQNGVHLRRCLFYIDMNMVRAGTVEHPAKWQHSSAYELASSRQRYHIIDWRRLMERPEIPDWQMYRRWYDESLDKILRAGLFRERQSFWASSAALGNAGWVGQSAEKIGMKRYDIIEANETWPEGVKSFFARAKNLS